MGWWKSLPTSWRTFLRLTAADRRTLLQALLLLPITAVAVRWLGLRRWQRTLQRWSPDPHADASGSPAAARAYRTAWLVRVAARFVAGRDSCLTQSLVLWWLLRCRGLAGDLRIGVRKRDERLEAHAWVECLGKVLDDPGDVTLPFVSFDRAIQPLESGSA